MVNSCENGWFQYENEKCVIIFDISSTYSQSVQYCKSAYKAKLLSISSIEEKDFFTLYLFRYLSTGENVWLESSDNNVMRKFGITNRNSDECFAMKSLKEENSIDSEVGDIVTQNCKSLGATVCEVSIKPKPKVEPKDRQIDPNEEFIPNRKIKLMNGNETELFTGLYYKIRSKFNDLIFMDQMRGIVSFMN